MFIKKEEQKAFWIQTAAWASLLILPALSTWILTKSVDMVRHVIQGSFPFIFTMALLFFLNVYWFVTEYLYKQKKRKFYLTNTVIILIIIALLTYINYLRGNYDTSQGLARTAFGLLFMFGYYFASMAFAILIRASMQREAMVTQLKEEKQKRIEAELTMLKNQLNPHFLFNTLNNISSLVQINADAAQESIGELSDLLRYSLYESNKKEMPIENEIEFMSNYIELMKLRLNELAETTVDMPKPNRPIKIAPLLFISLIENAFKHGINSRKKSFVHFSLHLDEDSLTFTAVNSMFPKPDTDRISSGVGIANTQRRLELAYPGHYEYIHEQRGDTYFAQIKLNNCL